METGAHRPQVIDVPICLVRTRIKLGAFVLLTIAAAVYGGSPWVTLALAGTCVGILLAVVALGGPRLVRALLLGAAHASGTTGATRTTGTTGTSGTTDGQDYRPT
ncbi:hypothetical protein GCM10022224_011470 [Nonomuraea antimicrobica]|uniref:Uncharacterized protein n=1 Tax=Nonomuraea antimicrobica TaxID=561173 RepID=A0ABP7B7B5_9ACTN